MSWQFFLAALTGLILIIHGIDIAFINRDPPPKARIATRFSRRIAGLAVIALALANMTLNISSFSE
jgi:hypothetical protein